MIAELPPAGCTEGSVFAIEMATARARLDVTLTGVGFFERTGRDAGDASNGLRLAPIIDVAFGAEHAVAAPKRRRGASSHSCSIPSVERTVSKASACAGGS
jgi:hypothetical protein